MMNIEHILSKMVDISKITMKDKLVGVYLHGSLAMNCYNPKQSDVDLLIVVNSKLTSFEQKLITQQILSLYDDLSNSIPIEFSIVLQDVIHPFIFPTPFEYHFSNLHLPKYRADENYICGGFDDPDLAAHFTIIYERGITLYGVPIHDLFRPIDQKYYIQALMYDVEDASEKVITSPMYYVLNLCRVLLYLLEGNIASKKEGGEWGLAHLPQIHHKTITKALDQYTGKPNANQFDDTSLLVFSEYMLVEIKSAIATTHT